MGGFQYYNQKGPLYPLSAEDVKDHITNHGLIPPAEAELQAWSRGDWLSKSIAVAQTLWFIVQCSARRQQHLAITQLEVMTLAYTVMTVAMYVVWWQKPQNVGCPVRIPGEGKDMEQPEVKDCWEHVRGALGLALFGLGADGRRSRTKVPTFYSGNEDDGDVFAPALFSALFVAIIFGGIHCVAWSYPFPSTAEQLMWRICSIGITTLPLLFFVGGGVGLLSELDCIEGTFMDDVLMAFMALTMFLFPIAYVIGRGVLLTLCFTSLKSLPPDAYQVIQWTRYIPHIS